MNEDSYSEKLKNVGNGQSCKMLKCWLLNLKSHTLIDFIFKCDLNFKKMNANSYLGSWN